MNILAIDGSTKSSGIAIFLDGKLEHHECITASSTNLFKRIHKMTSRIGELLSEYDIDTVLVEDVLPADVKGNTRVYKALMYLQAEIADLVDECKKEIEFIFPSEWRAKCKIKQGRGVRRETGKAYDMAFVKETFGLDVGDDEADAICIGWSYYAKDPDVKIVDGFEFK